MRTTKELKALKKAIDACRFEKGKRFRWPLSFDEIQRIADAALALVNKLKPTP